MATAIIPLQADDLIIAAVEWLERFYPAVAVNLSPNSLTLEAIGLDQDMLFAIWRSALLNEQSYRAAGTHRRAMLERLTQ